MRRGSPFKKSVAGKSNPKPFGMGRAEFNAFTYQGQVGGSNKKVVKSQSFVNESKKPLESSKPRRNSLPSEHNLKNSCENDDKPRSRMKNRYSHITSKTDSGSRKMRSKSPNTMSNCHESNRNEIQKCHNKNIANIVDSEASETFGVDGEFFIEEFTLRDMQNSRTNNNIIVTFDSEADREVARIDSKDKCDNEHMLERKLKSDDIKVTYDVFDYEATAKNIAMGVIRVCSPDIPIFYASVDKGKTSPTFSEYDQKDPTGSPDLVEDEEDVSVCKTPDFEEEDVSEQSSKCWSLQCDHVSGEKKGKAYSSESVSDKRTQNNVRKMKVQSIETNVKEDESTTKRKECTSTSNITDRGPVSRSRDNKASSPPIGKVKTSENSIQVSASRKSPASEAAESSIFLDSMLTTIYSGEEYTNKEAISRNTGCVSEDLEEHAAHYEEVGLDNTPPSLLSVTAKDVSQNYSDQPQKGKPQTRNTSSTSPEVEEFIDSDNAQSCSPILKPQQVVASPTPSDNFSHQEIATDRTFDKVLTHYQQSLQVQKDDEIEEAVKRLNSMAEDNSEHSMSIDEYFRVFSPLYNSTELVHKRSPSRKSSPLSHSRKSSPVSDHYSEKRQLNSDSRNKSISPSDHYSENRRIKSGSRNKSASPICEFQSCNREVDDGHSGKRSPQRSSRSLVGCRTNSSNCTFNDAALDEEIRRIETKCSSGSESDGEPLSETLGRVEFVLDEITKMGTRLITKTVSRQSGKSSISSSPLMNFRWKGSPAPSIQIDSFGESNYIAKSDDQTMNRDKPTPQTSNDIDMSRILSKIDQVKDDVRKEKAVLKTTIRQTHDLLGFQNQVSNLKISSTPDIQDDELELWSKESFELLREHEAALQKILKYERKLDKLRAFMKSIARKRSAIETRIQSRMSVVGTPKGTPRGTPRTGSPVRLNSSHKHLKKGSTMNRTFSNSQLSVITNPNSYNTVSSQYNEHTSQHIKNETMGNQAGTVDKTRDKLVTKRKDKCKSERQDFKDEKLLLQKLQNLHKDSRKHSPVDESSKVSSKPNKKMESANSNVVYSSKDSQKKVEYSKKSSEKIQFSEKSLKNQEADMRENSQTKMIANIKRENGKSEDQTEYVITRPRDLLMQLPKYNGSITSKSPKHSKAQVQTGNSNTSKNPPHQPMHSATNTQKQGDRKQRRSDKSRQQNTSIKPQLSESRERSDSNSSASSAITISSTSSGVTLDDTRPSKIDRSCIIDKYLSSDTSSSVIHKDKQVVHGVIVGDRVLVRGRKNDGHEFHEDFSIETRQFHNSMY